MAEVLALAIYSLTSGESLLDHIIKNTMMTYTCQIIWWTAPTSSFLWIVLILASYQGSETYFLGLIIGW